MESSPLAFERRDSSSTLSSAKTDFSEKENVDSSALDGTSSIPAWKLPLTSALLQKASRIGDIKNESERQQMKSKRDSMIPIQAAISPELAEDEATAQLIQILLPCIICNRTFSPEALERHSKVCSQVNIKDPRRPTRGKFDSAEMRKKHTELEVYIPPPDSDSSDGNHFVRKGSCRLYNRENPSPFNRNSKARATVGSTPSSNSMIPTWRHKQHRAKTPEKLLPPEPFENLSEFGSEDSHDSSSTRAPQQRNLPSYAQPLSPTDTCPYCARNFNHKAYDRHVKFCQELYERKQYEHQPVPKEKEEALERQEIRTKYKPLKSSTSCGSLRSSVSPGRDFPSMMAMKFYGFMNRTFNKNFKKSNESLTAASCYGDYAARRASPAPSSIISVKTRPITYQRANTTITAPSRSLRAPSMGSNIPQRTKSIENMNLANSINNSNNNSYANQYSHVPSSGYGQQQQQQYCNVHHQNFNRNSKLRGSLHKNFYFNSSKRVGPEGTDAITTTAPTTTTTATLNNSELIITPMSLYSKNKILSERQNKQQREPYGSGNNDAEDYSNSKSHGLLLHSNDSSYDPYEKAARQFEELLKTQVKSEKNSASQTTTKSGQHHGRKVGLDRALRSVTEPFALPANAAQSEPKKSRESKKDGGDESFVFNLADDSYWDQILNKRKELKNEEEEVEEVKLKQDEQQRQQQQDDTDGKSRAVSNISSSVDSAFSRSDGADLEFEALESLVGVREPTTPGAPQSDVPSSLPALVSKPVENTVAARSVYSSPIISNYQPRSDKSSGVTTTPASLPSLFHAGSNHQQQQQAGNRPENNVENMSTGSSSSSVQAAAPAAPTPAKFCHECGMLYPTARAKFCPECGERRVIK